MKKILLVLCMNFALFSFSYSQNATGNCIVLQQPCDNDGILATIITSGMTLPLTFYYTQNNGSVVHSNVHAFSDTLRGIQMCSSVYVYDSLNHYLQLKTGMTPPFTTDIPVITNVTCPSKTGTAKITVNSGSMPDSVQWFTRSDSSQYPGTTGGSGKYKGTGNPMSLPSGNYIAIVYYNGCSQSTNVYISYTSNMTVNVTTTDANCTNGTATISKITGGIAPYTYKWSNGSNTSTVNNLVKGLYYVTVTDSQDCYQMAYANIRQAITITVTTTVKDATCLEKDGSIIAFAAGGTPPYSYLYNNGMTTQTINGLSGGTSFTVIATDAKGCTGQGYGTLKSTTPISVTYNTKPSSCTSPTGSATLVVKGGTAPYTAVWNTFPVQNSFTISNMPAGSYSFKVTDAEGCIQTGTAIIPPVSTINAYTSAIDAVCPNNNGSAHISVSGTNPPFQYLWNNGNTGQTITNVPSGSYSCKVTDDLGCSVTKNINVKVTSPVSLGLSSTPASCLYTSDGKISANASGGTPPYAFKWSDGQTGNTATGLAQGKYYVYVTDADGCTKNNYSVVGYNHENDSCYCSIKGKVYVDENNNCQYDSGETGIEHIMINCSGIGSTFTNANGNYSFLVPTGTYKLFETVQYIYPLAPCQDNAIEVTDTAKSGCINNVDFANIINPLHDIHIFTTYINPPIPGFNYSQGFVVQNDGTVKENDIQLDFIHDGQLKYLGATPEVYIRKDSVNQPNYYSDTTGFPPLKPGEALLLTRNFLVPVNIPLSTNILFNDTASYASPLSNWLNDYSPWNNVNKYQTQVVGSFDPNFIEVKPAGFGSEGYIYPSDSVLDYIVHFQNNGSYYAQNIVITDTLDKNLNWKTLKPGFSTNDYTAELSENGVLKFTFNNINLTWKAQNDILSRGFVTYSIQQNPGLTTFTKIQNQADIYFDFNPPVTTNTALNTIYRSPQTGINESKTFTGITIYPNPAKTELYISSKDVRLKFIRVYDITGRLLNSVIPDNSPLLKLDVSTLSKGIYFIELINLNGEKVNAKFVKE